jgi:polyhydroxyalkanoate synthesis regulator phasin
MGWRAIPYSKKSLDEMVEEGLISDEEAGAEKEVRSRIGRHVKELREQANSIDDQQMRNLALSGGR